MKNKLLSALMLFVGMLVMSPTGFANAQVSLVGDKIQRVQAKPGEQYTGTVMIHNESDDAIIIRLHQDEVAALTSFDTGDDVVTLDRSNANWVNLESKRITLQGGEIVELDYQVTVPEKIAEEKPAGTYWSTLTADIIGLGKGEYRRPYNRLRLAEITTDIENTGDMSLAINQIQVEGKEGKKRLKATMINTGTLLTQPDVFFEIYDNSGNLVERIKSDSYPVYPGGFSRIYAEISSLAPGIYETQVVVDAGTTDIFGASFTLDTTQIGRVASLSNESSAGQQ